MYFYPTLYEALVKANLHSNTIIVILAQEK